jgi:hypothetical protein
MSDLFQVAAGFSLAAICLHAAGLIGLLIFIALAVGLANK